MLNCCPSKVSTTTLVWLCLMLTMLPGCSSFMPGTSSQKKVVVIKVTRGKPQTTTLHLPKNELSKIVTNNISEGVTQWVYLCHPEFQLVKDVKQKQGGWFEAAIRLESVTVRLGLTITISLLADASQNTIDHENGHAEICKRVYSTAEAAAQKAAGEAMKKVFSGSGRTEAEAIERCVTEAREFFCSVYSSEVNITTNQVSNIYDAIDRDGPQGSPSIETVEVAFRQFKLQKESERTSIIN